MLNKAFKAEIATPRVLSYYNIDADIKISADASI